MRICVACCGWGEWPICASCRSGLHPVAPVRLSSGLLVYAAYSHHGTARTLVHRLKYDGMRRAAQLLAAAMVEALPQDVVALVPVPRAMARRARYGVDPAVLLAEFIAERAGLPVVSALRAPVWWPANAGTTRTRRQSPGFRVVRAAPSGSVLVDDVATTGATLRSAAAVAGLGRALTATRAGGTVSR